MPGMRMHAFLSRKRRVELRRHPSRMKRALNGVLKWLLDR
ncbi:conserved hypothetical protein [Burkholderia vietnamiensis]|nr:hypothetical protein MYA_3696 [Burkholderia sp. KJ006]CAG9195785.1 conserved hypothetical protein [Burkholderia vietnamiensis]CAG9218731.1 conserved hypothetical protein [Burkholderia vietnamiensis]